MKLEAWGSSIEEAADAILNIYLEDSKCSAETRTYLIGHLEDYKLWLKEQAKLEEAAASVVSSPQSCRLGWRRRSCGGVGGRG